MNSLPRARDVRFDEDSMWVSLDDGRVLGVPLAWFPRLFHATPQQRTAVKRRLAQIRAANHRATRAPHPIATP